MKYERRVFVEDEKEKMFRFEDPLPEDVAVPVALLDAARDRFGEARITGIGHTQVCTYKYINRTIYYYFLYE
jgi:hypothetical protein